MRKFLVATLVISPLLIISVYRLIPRRLHVSAPHAPRVPGFVYCGDFPSDTDGRVLKRNGMLTVSNDNHGVWIGDGDQTLYRINLNGAPFDIKEYHGCGAPLETNGMGHQVK